MDFDEKLKKLVELRNKAEAERYNLEQAVLEVRKEAEVVIPQIQGEIQGLDKQIVALNEKRQELFELLKLVGGVVKRPEGTGMKARLMEFVEECYEGSILTLKEIEEFLGSTSGYVIMLLKQLCEEGVLEEHEQTVYEVK